MARTRQRPAGGAVMCVLALALALLGAPAPASADELGPVSGVVTAGGAPLSAAWVVLTPVTATGDWAGKSSQTATDEAGRYSFDGLAHRHVKVHVRSPLVGNFVATFWPGVYTFGQAGVIPVTAAGFVADISLPTGRAIAGQVVAQDTGEPVEGALLMARIAEAPWAEPAGRFEPGSAPGRFEITGLPPVPIRLHVQVPQDSPFLGDGYWSDSALETGRRVDAPGDVTGLAIRLPRGGEVSGTVRDGLDNPVAGAAVRIENCQYGCPREATSDASGDYRIRGIPPSDRLIARAAAPGAIDQWFAGVNDWIAATDFALGPGEVRAGVDFVLVGGGVLVGRVIAGDTGQPLTELAAYVESVVEPGRRWFADVTGEATGTFRIGPVPPDSYRLVLLPSSRRSLYWPARWLTSTGIDTSGVIRLDPGQEVEVEVRLARTQTAIESDTLTEPPQCLSPASGWTGLFRGFLGDEPWPRPLWCPPGTA